MITNREKSDFEKGAIDDDVATLRFKHYQARLIDLINELLVTRKQIVEQQKRLDQRAQQNNTVRSSPSPGFHGGGNPSSMMLN